MHRKYSSIRRFLLSELCIHEYKSRADNFFIHHPPLFNQLSIPIKTIRDVYLFALNKLTQFIGVHKVTLEMFFVNGSFIGPHTYKIESEKSPMKLPVNRIFIGPHRYNIESKNKPYEIACKR